jgi:hypothetical protein
MRVSHALWLVVVGCYPVVNIDVDEADEPTDATPEGDADTDADADADTDVDTDGDPPDCERIADEAGCLDAGCLPAYGEVVVDLGEPSQCLDPNTYAFLWCGGACPDAVGAFSPPGSDDCYAVYDRCAPEGWGWCNINGNRDIPECPER